VATFDFPFDTITSLAVSLAAGSYNIVVESVSTECYAYRLDFGIETTSSLTTSLTCPSPITTSRLPRRNIAFRKESATKTGDFYFTYSDWEDNQLDVSPDEDFEYMNYQILAKPFGSVKTQSKLHYNFVGGGFAIRGTTFDNRTGWLSASESTTHYNYKMYATQELEEYDADTYFTVGKNDVVLEESACYPFQYTVTSQTTASEEQELLWIYPSGHSIQPPPRILNIRFGFSHKISQPTRRNIQQAVLDNKAIYLTYEDDNGTHQVYPDSVKIVTVRDIVTAVFKHLSPGGTSSSDSLDYTLTFDPTIFHGRNSSAFSFNSSNFNLDYTICGGSSTHNGACFDD